MKEKLYESGYVRVRYYCLPRYLLTNISSSMLCIFVISSILFSMYLCCQSRMSRPLLRRSGAARPPSATGMDVVARDLDRIFALLHWSRGNSENPSALLLCTPARLRHPGEAATPASANTSSTPRSTLRACDTVRTFLSQSEWKSEWCCVELVGWCEVDVAGN